MKLLAAGLLRRPCKTAGEPGPPSQNLRKYLVHWRCEAAAFALLAGIAVAHANATVVEKRKVASKTSLPVKRAALRTKSGRSAHKSKTRKAIAAAPTFQTHPDPERYTEIQRALAERGYFKGEPNGEWQDDSVDALRHFQTDQKLPDDGKISALSLTALGLGPRHDGSTAASVPVAPPSPSVDSAPPTSDDAIPPQQ